VGPDGNIWFTESSGAKIGRLVLDKPAGGGGGGPGGGGAGGGGGAVVDRFAPRFDRRLALLRARFRAGATATPVSAVRRPVTPVGSAFTFTLSEPATVAISIARRAAGRRVGRLCRAPSRANRGRAPCVRYVNVGALRRRGLQGPNRVTFSGRIGARRLAPGAYRASAVAKDAAGNASPASLAAFTVVTR
jgi:hypothetical protein